MTMKIGSSDAQTVNLFHERIGQKEEGRNIIKKIKDFFILFTKDEPKSLDKPEDRRVIARNMVKLYAEGVKKDPYLTLQGFQTTFSHALITCPKLKDKSTENLNKTIEFVMQNIRDELVVNKSLARSLSICEDQMETRKLDGLDIEVAKQIYAIEKRLYDQEVQLQLKANFQTNSGDRSVSVDQDSGISADEYDQAETFEDPLSKVDFSSMDYNEYEKFWENY